MLTKQCVDSEQFVSTLRLYFASCFFFDRVFRATTSLRNGTDLAARPSSDCAYIFFCSTQEGTSLDRWVGDSSSRKARVSRVGRRFFVQKGHQSRRSIESSSVRDRKAPRSSGRRVFLQKGSSLAVRSLSRQVFVQKGTSFSVRPLGRLTQKGFVIDRPSTSLETS